MSKKTKIFSTIIFILIMFTGILGYKLINANQKINSYNQNKVYRVKDTVIFLLNNVEIEQNTEDALMRNLELDLQDLRPKVNVKSNTTEEVDEVTRLWWRPINTDYKNVKEQKKKEFLDKYEHGMTEISASYNTNDSGENLVNLKQFLIDVGNLGEW
ncbi:MAG: hypothetical protein ACRCYE_03220 [Sarcina sp.]